VWCHRLSTRAGQAELRSEARSEWAALAQLLTQVLEAHTDAIPDAGARDMAQAALAGLMAASSSGAAAMDTRCSCMQYRS
jgi:hypothetical protein